MVVVLVKVMGSHSPRISLRPNVFFSGKNSNYISPCVDDVTVFIKIVKDSSKKKVEVFNHFKINICKHH